MVKIRQDAWMHENDAMLAEMVLRHVREGSTQLNAFEEAGDELNRTAAACGFRWNAVVRHQYETELKEAKKERKEKLRILGKDYRRRGNGIYLAKPQENGERVASVPVSALSIDIIIAYLVRLQHSDSDVTRYRHLASISTEKIRTLESELAKLEKENIAIKQDYEQFVQIMNRARRLVTLDDESTPTMPIFQMEKNGNLVSKEPPTV
ncbi:RsfA family transcriptional regulator [Psychrobacillus sp.]|uniref:RsfA family transcriptional regulator n=1 Tax=Psychrobacillus sp. TaxID=1871623 RepID=UPI0028BE39C8|nr:RsfA family transcriptional regulator [Psychrobacillus sp.]